MAKSKTNPQFRLIVGDCVEELPKLNEKIDLIAADPPYSLGQDYDAYNDRMGRDRYLSWSASWITAAYHQLAEHGSMWIAIGDHFVSEIDVFAKSLGLTKKAHVIWYFTFGQHHNKNFMRSHTHWLYYTKHKTICTFNADDIRVPSARQLVYKDKRAASGGRLPDDTWILRPQMIPESFQPLEDTWYFSRICGTFKARCDISPNQMPVPMLERIVKLCSNPGDLVVDNFLGTGTTIQAAVMHGRRGIGIDLSRKCVDESNKRIMVAVKAIENPVQPLLFPAAGKPKRKAKK